MITKRSAIRLMRMIDNGYAHCLPAACLSRYQRTMARALVDEGFLRWLPARRSFPERLVVTRNGSYALGTFDVVDPRFGRIG